MLPALGITGQTLGIREIPGRPALQFFLWPSKRGYFGARQFAEAALHNLPPNAIIIADYTVAEPMLYLQIAEHFRSDVTVAVLAMDEQLPFALVQSRHTQVFLALTGTYYDIQGLREHFNQ
jgi:hypothetical protein